MTDLPDGLEPLASVVARDERWWTYARLSQELGISVSEAHACIKRGLLAGLLLPNREATQPTVGADGPDAVSAQEPAGIYRVTRKRVRRAALPDTEAVADNPVRPHVHNLAEFALHGAKYAFPAVKLPLGAGVPTSTARPPLPGCLRRAVPILWGRTPTARCAAWA